jgi:hypothetical protein
MLAVLGGLADVERDLIRTRMAQGRSRAKVRGQRMGRPSKLTDAQKVEARHRAEDVTFKELAESYDVGWRRSPDCALGTGSTGWQLPMIERVGPQRAGSGDQLEFAIDAARALLGDRL